MTRTWLLLFVVLASYYTSFTVEASAVLSFPRQHPAITTASSSDDTRGVSRFRTSRRSSLFWGGRSIRYVSMAARKDTKVITEERGGGIRRNEPQGLQDGPSSDDFSFDDLGPFGKVVASTTELAVTVVWNYLQGYLTGYFFGSVIGIPGFLFRPIEKGLPSQPFMTEMSARFARMNTRSVNFGKNFGGVSAVFKGSDTAIRRLRYGKEDEWNDILGSAVAGAIFGRKGMFGRAIKQSRKR